MSAPDVARPDEREGGYTLVEVLVAMSIFTVLLGVVMAAVIGLSRSALHSQDTADTAADVRVAFERMDKQVRYASAVNFPGEANGAYWVEFRTTPVTSASTAPAATCVQWRYLESSGALQVRSWTEGTTTALPAFSTLFTSGAQASRGDPFTMLPTSTTQQMQELTVSLTDTRTAGGSSGLQTTFVARNSSATSPGNVAVDPSATPLVSADPVCAPTGYRTEPTS